MNSTLIRIYSLQMRLQVSAAVKWSLITNLYYTPNILTCKSPDSLGYAIVSSRTFSVPFPTLVPVKFTSLSTSLAFRASEDVKRYPLSTTRLRTARDGIENYSERQRPRCAEMNLYIIRQTQLPRYLARYPRAVQTTSLPCSSAGPSCINIGIRRRAWTKYR
jgi:hypothetical protein